MKRLIILFVCLSWVTLIDAQATGDTVVFKLNKYLLTSPSSPYPLFNRCSIRSSDTVGFVNVMNFGAFGDGVHIDDNAIVAAINAAPDGSGVIFPSGRVFLSSVLNTVSITKDITFYAYGATIKKVNNSRYSFLQISSPGKTVIWLGGTFDGNKDNQSWPGSPTGDTAWEEDHGQFFRILNAQNGLIKDVRVTHLVMDGVTLSSTNIAIVVNCTADSCAPLKYGEVQDQATCYKVRQTGASGTPGTAFYCFDLNLRDASIGIHYSTNNVEDSSVTVLNNCVVRNMSQDAIHMEHSRYLFMYNTTVSKDTTTKIFAGVRVPKYSGDIHISSDNVTYSIKNCIFTNVRIDNRIGGNRIISIIDSTSFTNTDTSNVSIDDAYTTHVINSSFEGRNANQSLTLIRNARKLTFTDFGNKKAMSFTNVADSCTFVNGTISPISTSGTSPAVHGCTFTSCPANTQVASLTSLQLARFNSFIRLQTEAGVLLGIIKAK